MSESPYPGPPRRSPLPPLSAPPATEAPPSESSPTEPLDPPPSRRLGAGAVVGGAVAAALVGGLGAVGLLSVTGNLGDETRVVTTSVNVPSRPVTAPSPTAPPSPVLLPVVGKSVEALARDASPGVVAVEVRTATGGGSGSGFLIDGNGRVLTNAHVVTGATRIQLRFKDLSVREARVLGSDPSTDLAVLKADRVPATAAPLPLGSSRGLTVGAPVVAIGNPLGLEQSVTSGIVSALKRPIDSLVPNVPIQNAIQTDAAINPGNSGGPLLDAAGTVVGVNSQIRTQSGGNEGIGFAIPIDTAKPIAASIIETGKAQHAWIGITATPFTPDEAGRYGLNLARSGVAVQCVVKGSPAARAGLRGAANPSGADARGGDVFVSVDGRAIGDNADLNAEIATRRVGERITAQVLRRGAPVTVDMTLGDRPSANNCS
ncbi:MAG: trypsin-like peptidase domain-containing protein [Actinobacteria bacterium]|nr:trypsin-like peptidase domain-containing protein [Actinomycetota bacterium]